MWRVLSWGVRGVHRREKLRRFRGVQGLLKRGLHQRTKGAGRWERRGRDKAIPGVTSHLYWRWNWCWVRKWTRKKSYQAVDSLDGVPAHGADFQLRGATVTETPGRIVFVRGTFSWYDFTYLCLQGMSCTLARLSKQRVQAFSCKIYVQLGVYSIFSGGRL